MEGLRGLAVILVFFVHYGSQLTDSLAVPLPVAGLALQHVGHAGVDLFFVLSGYLIYDALIHRPRPFPGFMARRVQRIYPAFLVAFGLHLMLAALSTSGGGLLAAGQALLILQNLLLLPGIFSIPALMPVAWSLSYEMAAYLTIPTVIWVLRRWTPAWRVAALLSVALIMQLLGWTHARIGIFACGMVLAEVLPLMQERLRHAGGLDVLALAALPACGAVLLAEPPALVTFCALFLTCFLVCTAALGREGPVARLLAVRPLRWLGNMSYSYYLLHGFVLNLLFFTLRGAPPLLLQLGEAAYWLLLPPAFLLTVIGSVPLYLLADRPFSIPPARRSPKPRLGAAVQA